MCLSLPLIPIEVENLLKMWLAYKEQAEPGQDEYLEQPPLVERAIALLEHNLGDPWSVDALAREVASNRNTLTQAFTREYGVGPMGWLRKKRMQSACELLAQSALPVSEIAYRLGYLDVANFSTAFKREIGRSPAHYRKQMTNSQQAVSFSKE